MTGCRKDSPWYSTPKEKRKRKGIEVTLSDEARAKLDRMAGKGLRSAVVERLIMDAPEKGEEEREKR